MQQNKCYRNRHFEKSVFNLKTYGANDKMRLKRVFTQNVGIKNTLENTAEKSKR